MVADLYQSAGTRARRRDRLGRRLRHRRLGQVAVRRPGRRLPLRGAAAAATGCEPRVTGWMAHEQPFAFEPGRDRLRQRRRRASCTARRPCPRSTPRRPATRSWTPIGVDAIRAQVACARCSCSSTWRASAGFAPRTPERPGAARRDGDPRRAPRRRRSRASCCAARSSSTTARRRHPRLSALLHDRRRAPPRRRPRSRAILDSGAYRAHERAGGTGF